MYFLENENYVMIPLSFNIFYRESAKNKRYISFAREFSVSDGLFDELQTFIREKGKNRIISIDMERVTYPGKMFRELEGFEQKIIFYNVKSGVLIDRMQEDIPKLNWSQDDKVCILNGMISDSILNDYWKVFLDEYEKLYSRILLKINDSCKKDDPLLLDSSGLYSNMYITVKKLFLEPEDYYFVLFGMAMEVEKMGEFDGFISSSKNGAVLANLLGSMLNKKVVHIQGVGPKYSMRFGNVQNEIKRGKTYVHVFDFICTGTELKLLSALVNANDAYMVGSIGFAMYDAEGKKERSVFGKVRCLITTKAAGINYKIAGSKEDMGRLMND